MYFFVGRFFLRRMHQRLEEKQRQKAKNIFRKKLLLKAVHTVSKITSILIITSAFIVYIISLPESTAFFSAKTQSEIIYVNIEQQAVNIMDNPLERKPEDETTIEMTEVCPEEVTDLLEEDIDEKEASVIEQEAGDIEQEVSDIDQEEDNGEIEFEPSLEIEEKFHCEDDSSETSE